MVTKSETKFTVKDIKSRTDDNELDLSVLQISNIPVKQIAAIPKITSIDLSANQITTIPKAFCNLTQIVHLDLSQNGIITFPEEFGKLVKLQKLDLYRNKIEVIPPCFGSLISLRWLDLKENLLDENFINVIGDCLDDVQCRNCARNVVSICGELAAEQEKKRQKKMKEKQKQTEKKRRQKEKDEQAKKEQIKEQKRLEKIKRREHWERMKQIEEQEKLAACTDYLDSLENKSVLPEKPLMPKRGRGSFCFISLLILLIAVASAWFFKRETFFSKAASTETLKRLQILCQLSHQLYLNFIETSRPFLALAYDKSLNFCIWMQDYFNYYFQT